MANQLFSQLGQSTSNVFQTPNPGWGGQNQGTGFGQSIGFGQAMPQTRNNPRQQRQPAPMTQQRRQNQSRSQPKAAYSQPSQPAAPQPQTQRAKSREVPAFLQNQGRSSQPSQQVQGIIPQRNQGQFGQRGHSNSSMKSSSEGRHSAGKFRAPAPNQTFGVGQQQQQFGSGFQQNTPFQSNTGFQQSTGFGQSNQFGSSPGFSQSNQSQGANQLFGQIGTGQFGGTQFSKPEPKHQGFKPSVNQSFGQSQPSFQTNFGGSQKTPSFNKQSKFKGSSWPNTQQQFQEKPPKQTQPQQQLPPNQKLQITQKSQKQFPPWQKGESQKSSKIEEKQPQSFQEKKEIEVEGNEDEDDEYYGGEDYYGEEEEGEEEYGAEEGYGEEEQDGGGFGENVQQRLEKIKEEIEVKNNMCRFFVHSKCNKAGECQFNHSATIKAKILREMQNIAEEISQKQTKPEKVEEPAQEQAEELHSKTYNQIALKNKGKNLNQLLGLASSKAPNDPSSAPLKVQVSPSKSSALTLGRRASKANSSTEDNFPKPTLSKKALGGKQLGKALLSKGASPKKAISDQLPAVGDQIQVVEEEVKVEREVEVSAKEVQRRMIANHMEMQQILQQPNKWMIPGKAELLMKCSEEEIQQRMTEYSLSVFEQDKNGQGQNKFAMKAYQRSAADREMNNPSNIRPSRVLFQSALYLKDVIVDQDLLAPGSSLFKYADGQSRQHPFIEIYHFVRDRARSILQDFIILDDHQDEYEIRSTELICRYLIISFHDGYHLQDFDSHQHTQILSKALGALIYCYQSVEQSAMKSERKQELLKNKAEFFSYLAILSSSGSDLINFQQSLRRFKSEGSPLLRSALKIHCAIANKSTAGFFSLLQRTDYMFACLMLNFLKDMRRDMLLGLYQSFTAPIPLDFLKKLLKFSSIQDTVNFVHAVGLTVIQNENKYYVRKLPRLPDIQFSEKYKKYKQAAPLLFMEDKRGALSRRDVMDRGVLLESFKPAEQQDEDDLDDEEVDDGDLYEDDEVDEADKESRRIVKVNKTQKQQEQQQAEEQKEEAKEENLELQLSKTESQLQQIQKEKPNMMLIRVKKYFKKYLKEQIAIERQKKEQQKQKKKALKQMLMCLSRADNRSKKQLTFQKLVQNLTAAKKQAKLIKKANDQLFINEVNEFMQVEEDHTVKKKIKFQVGENFSEEQKQNLLNIRDKFENERQIYTLDLLRQKKLDYELSEELAAYLVQHADLQKEWNLEAMGKLRKQDKVDFGFVMRNCFNQALALTVSGNSLVELEDELDQILGQIEEQQGVKLKLDKDFDYFSFWMMVFKEILANLEERILLNDEFTAFVEHLLDKEGEMYNQATLNDSVHKFCKFFKAFEVPLSKLELMPFHFSHLLRESFKQAELSIEEHFLIDDPVLFHQISKDVELFLTGNMEKCNNGKLKHAKGFTYAQIFIRNLLWFIEGKITLEVYPFLIGDFQLITLKDLDLRTLLSRLHSPHHLSRSQVNDKSLRCHFPQDFDISSSQQQQQQQSVSFFKWFSVKQADEEQRGRKEEGCRLGEVYAMNVYDEMKEMEALEEFRVEAERAMEECKQGVLGKRKLSEQESEGEEMTRESVKRCKFELEVAEQLEQCKMLRQELIDFLK